jgi:hypothetical protein
VHTIGRIFIGTVAALLLFAIWTAGAPPAVSLFWKTGTATIIGHETGQWDSGWGVFERTLPQIEPGTDVANDQSIMLHVSGQISNRDAIVKQWPVGQSVRIRLHPSRSMAFPAETWPFMTIPAFGMTTILLALAGWQIRRVFRRRITATGPQTKPTNDGSASWILAAFVLLFTAVPLFLLIFVTNHGDPPPRSILWPREPVEIVSSQVRIHNVGNGTKAAYVDVVAKPSNTLDSASEPLNGITYSWIPIPEAQEMVASQYPPGMVKTAMRSPMGELYIVRFRSSDAFAILAILLSLLCLFVVGLLWRIFR